jgi:MFS family permease
MISPQESALFRKVSWHLLPILFVCYLINYIDRVNISFAELTMSKSLGMAEAAYGLGAGLFFIGYFSCQVPSNLLLHKFGARRWIGLIIFVWGFISAGIAFVKEEWHFYLIRFVLGAAEAGFFPGVILYLTWWYPTTIRARIVALFLTAIPVAGLIGGPLSGWIMHTFQGGGMEGWQWLFIIEGLPCLAVAFWVWKGLPDRPHEAKWLDLAEKNQIEDLLRHEAEARARLGAPDKASAVFKMPVVWVFCLLYFCTMMGLYGLSFWLPKIIKGLGWQDPLQIGLISAIPWMVAVVFMIAWGAKSDRDKERRLHAATAALLATIGFAGCGFVHQSFGGLVSVAFAAAGVMGLMAVLWAMPGALLNGTAAAAGIALINSFGNLGGFVSPTAIGFITERTQSHSAGQYLTAGFLLLAAILLFSLKFLSPKTAR